MYVYLQHSQFLVLGFEDKMHTCIPPSVIGIEDKQIWHYKRNCILLAAVLFAFPGS